MTSLTTAAREVERDARSATVVFSTTVPRGRTSASASPERAGRAGRVDDQVGAGIGRPGGEPQPPRDGELAGVTAGERDAGAGCREHLRDQEPELAVAEHERSHAVDVAELLEDLERGRDRLGEDRGPRPARRRARGAATPTGSASRSANAPSAPTMPWTRRVGQ